MKTNNLLLEIFTEELPPKNLLSLIESLSSQLSVLLQKNNFAFQSISGTLATPRRLAVIVKGLAERQAEREIENKRFFQSLYDGEGKPNLEALHFAKACGKSLETIEKQETGKGILLIHREKKSGQTVFQLIPSLIEEAITQLPIPKMMRWGDKDTQFVRPVHSVILMVGKKVIPATILGCKTSNQTQGHRFLSRMKNIKITSPDTYLKTLKKTGCVIVDFTERQKNIETQILKIAKSKKAEAIIPPALLEEVTAATEWPASLTVSFPKTFLNLPKELLMAAMQVHQRSFPLIDKQKNLLPFFIAITNIETKEKALIISGNERVMNARLSDAKFFYETDLKIPLEKRAENLKQVVFQKPLGTLWDKTERIQKLSRWIAEQLKLNAEEIKETTRAAALSKADLMTLMVGEFPELQGIAGYYYAKHQGEKESVALAIKEHYQPRFAEDDLPASTLGQILALADRADTLVGLFGIQKIPSGDKDPFALRRATLGMIRLFAKAIPLSIPSLIEAAIRGYGSLIPKEETNQAVMAFVSERTKYWLIEQSFTIPEWNAVFVNGLKTLPDFTARIEAVRFFLKMPEAASLAVANKRVKNILEKEKVDGEKLTFNESLLNEKTEIALANALKNIKPQLEKLEKAKEYATMLSELATLKPLIDDFFDHVMVMVENMPLRQARLALLYSLRQCFLKVADISELKIEK